MPPAKPPETFELFKVLIEKNYFATAVRLWGEAFSLVQMLAAFRMAKGRLTIAGWPAAEELRQMFLYVEPGLHPGWMRDEITADALEQVSAGGTAVPEALKSGWREFLMALWDDRDGKLFAATVARVNSRRQDR
jgi:hypothetical protein